MTSTLAPVDLEGPNPSPEVTIRSQEDPDVSVRLLDRQFIDEDETVFTIDAHADGLHARIRDVTVAVWDREYLPDFPDGLVADFRGWTGERTWDTHCLRLRAAFHSGGHVELTWTLRPWASSRSSWETSHHDLGRRRRTDVRTRRQHPRLPASAALTFGLEHPVPDRTINPSIA